MCSVRWDSAACVLCCVRAPLHACSVAFVLRCVRAPLRACSACSPGNLGSLKDAMYLCVRAMYLCVRAPLSACPACSPRPQFLAHLGRYGWPCTFLLVFRCVRALLRACSCHAATEPNTTHSPTSPCHRSNILRIKCCTYLWTQGSCPRECSVTSDLMPP